MIRVTRFTVLVVVAFTKKAHKQKRAEQTHNPTYLVNCVYVELTSYVLLNMTVMSTSNIEYEQSLHDINTRMNVYKNQKL